MSLDFGLRKREQIADLSFSYSQLKADLLSVLDKFFEHAAQLDNLFVPLFPFVPSVLPFLASLISFSPSPSLGLIFISDDGWKAFMALFLQSIQPIVPEPGSFKAKRSSPSTPCLEQQQHKGIPSAFVEEIETLRTRVEELSDEVSWILLCKRDELDDSRGVLIETRERS